MKKSGNKFSINNKLIISIMVLLFVTIIISISSVSAANEICTDISVDPIKSIEPHTPFSITGKLYDSSNSKGIGGQLITVKITNPMTNSTIDSGTANTNSNGNFKIDLNGFSIASRLIVKINYEGNASIKTSPSSLNKEVQGIRLATFFKNTYTTKEGQAGGILVDENGNPLAGKNVYLTVRDSNKNKIITIMTETLTDGSFNFTNHNIVSGNNLELEFLGEFYNYYKVNLNIYHISNDNFSIDINPIKHVITGELVNLTGTMTIFRDSATNSHSFEIWNGNTLIKNLTFTGVTVLTNFNFTDLNLSNGLNYLSFIYKQNGEMRVNLSFELLAVQIPTYIEIDHPMNIIKDKNNSISGKLYDIYGVGISNKTISIYIDGVFIQNVTTSKDGKFQINNYVPTSLGNHNLTVAFGKINESVIVVTVMSLNPTTSNYEYPTNNYHKFNKTIQFNVLGSPVSKLEYTNLTVNNPTVYTTESFTINGILTDQDNKPIANAKVFIYLNGTIYGNATTNSTGHYSYTNYISKGCTYNIEVKFLGEGGNIPSTANGKLTIIRTPTKMIVDYSKNLTVGKLMTIVVTLMDTYNNKPIAGANIELEIDGISFPVKTTDANGKVSFDFNPTLLEHTIELSYSGNETYVESKYFAIEKINDTIEEEPPEDEPEPEEYPPTYHGSGIEMKKTGNPIAILLLSIFSILIIGIRKMKFN